MLYVFGLTQGGFDNTITILINRTYSLSAIGKILGTLQIGIFIGAATGPFLGGLIFDTLNSNTLAFLIIAGTILIRILLMILIKQETGMAKVVN